MRAFLISQQSRFLALVSNYSRLAELTEEAANAQDAGTLQYLKTLDSIESKMNQLKVAFQEFYTSMGLENLFKGALDSLTGFISTLNSLPKLFDTIPVAAIGMATNLILAIKNILSMVGILFYQQFQQIKSAITEVTGTKHQIKLSVNKDEFKKEVKTTVREAITEAQHEANNNSIDLAWGSGGKTRKQLRAEGFFDKNETKHFWETSVAKVIGNTIKLAGATVSAALLTKQNTAESMINTGRENSKVWSGGVGLLGNVAGGFVSGGLAGALIGLAQSIPNIITLFDGLTATSKEVVAQLNKEIQKQKEQVILRKGEVNELEVAAKKLEELREHQYDSTEANQEYIDYMNQLGSSHQELISRLDAEGNSVIELKDVYQQLIGTRAKLTEEELKQRKLELQQATLKANNLNDIVQFFDYTAFLDFINKTNGDIRKAPKTVDYSWNDLISANLTTDNKQDYSLALATRVTRLGDSGVWNDIFPDVDWTTVWKSIKENYKNPSLEFVRQLQQYLQTADTYYDNVSAQQEELAKINKQLGEVNNQVNKWVAQQSTGKAETIQKQLSQFQTNPVVNLITQQLEQLKDLDLETDEGKKVADKILTPLLSEYKSKGEQWDEEYTEYYIGMFNHTNEEIEAFLSNLKSSDNEFDDERLAGYEQKYNDELKDLETNYYTRIDAFFDQYREKLGIDGTPYGEVSSIKKFAGGQWDALITQLYDGVGAYVDQGLYARAKQYYDDYTPILDLVTSKATDSETSNSIANLIKSHDLTDYDSITQLISSLEDYDTANEEIDLADVIDQLNAIKINLASNINTIVSSYADEIKTKAESFDKIIKSGFSGMNLEDALETAKTLAAGTDKTAEELIRWDSTLKQFVLSVEGINLAREAVFKELNEKYQQSIDEFTEQQHALQWLTEAEFNGENKFDITTVEGKLQEDYEQAIANDPNLTFDEWKKEKLEQLSKGLKEYNDLNEWLLQYIDSQSAQAAWATLNWDKLKLGAYNEKAQDEAAVALQTYFKAIQATDEFRTEILNRWLEGDIAGVYEALRTAGNIKFDYGQSAALIENKFANAADKISDIFNTTFGTTISEELNNFAVSIGATGFEAEVPKVIGSFEDAVESARAIYAAMKANNASIIDLNYTYAAILEGEQLQKDAAKGIIESSADLSYDNLADYANLINQDLEQIVADGVLIIQDAFGKYRITDKGIETLLANADASVSGWELAEVIKSRNEALIKADKEITGTIVDEVNALTSAKVGDKLDLTYVQNAFGDFGGQLVNGILEVTENTNILQLASDIRAQMEASGQFLQSDIVALGDAIDSLLKSYASLISGGIQGSLSQTDAANLKGFAKNSLGVDIDFTRTKNGLKISTDQAGKLYQELKKVDSITAQLVFDDFVESLSEAGSGFENISQTMARIAETQRQIAEAQGDTSGLQEQLVLYQEIARAQSDNPDSFSFMDNSIPAGMQGPENYWNAVGTAFKVMNQAGQSGYMEIQDFYNITQEMKNLAIMSGNDLQFMGQTIYADGSGAAELIQMAMSALSNIDGEGVKVDFSKLGQSFSGGAADMASGFDDAVKTMAKSQIEMLDAEIAMLEAIVAMEKLGDIDVDQNGVFSIGDIFTGETEWDEQSQQFLSKFTTEYQTFAQDLLKTAESNDDLAKALDEVIINEHSLRELVEDATDGLKNLNISEEAYFAVLDALVEAGKSGEYDLENLGQSLQQIWSNTGEIAEIQIGDKTFVIGYGAILQPDENGEYTVDGTKYSDPESALKALTISKIDGAHVQVNETTGEVTGEVTIDQTKFTINPLADGSVEYTTGNFTTTSQQEAYHQAYLDYKQHAEGAGIPVEDEVEWQMRVLGHVVVGEVTIDDPDAFKRRMHKDVVDLAKKLNSGTDEEIVEYAAKLGIKVDYSDTLGLTEEQRQQITELAGIESKVVTEDIAINITGEDAENTKKLLSDEPLDKVVNLQLQRGEGADPILAELLDNQTTPTQRSMEVDVSATGEFTTDFVDSLNNLNAENLEIVVTKLAALSSSTRNIQNADFSNIEGLSTQWEEVLAIVQEVSNLVASLTEKTFTVNVETAGMTVPTVNTSTSTSGQTTPSVGGGSTINADTTPIALPGPDIKEWTDAATAVSDASVTAASGLTNVATPLEKMPDVSGRIDSLVSAMQKIPTYAASRVAALASSMAAIQSKAVTLRANLALSVTATGTTGIEGTGTKNLSFTVNSKGNVALAGGSKRTLVGELGPELVVSHGHYYVVGQNGAEFVDLDKDAIVFNHLQTKKLLGSGRSGRGTAITNERNAVSWATGNTSGPAMASASEALALLKQIRAMWQSLLGASLKDLGGLAGRGGSGRGGGGGNTKFSPQIGTFERWYNLMRQIADLEQKITLEEAKRKNMRNGTDYSRSLQKELAMLQTQLADQKELNYLQQDYLKHEIADFNKTQFTKIFTFTQDGLMQFVDGPGRGLDVLSKLTATDENGRYIRKLDDTAVNQLKYLESVGFDYSAFTTDQETGNKLNPATEEDAAKIVETFWDRLQYYLDNIDGLRDTIADGLVQEQELLTKIAEIQQEYIDNQLKLEQNLVKAIEDRQQAIIDGLTDEKDAIQEATQAYIDGLSDALQRERDMYQKNQRQQETLQLQRQLAILQRSGGSAADIKNLQDQISGRLQDRYFDAQQEQIDAVQAASDREIERLDYQIELMTEALEYQKENGLLWNEVYQMLEKWTPEQMVEFYERYTKEYQSKSALDKEQSSQEVLTQAQMQTQNRDASAGWAAYSATLPSRNVTAAAGYDMAAIEATYKSAHGTGGAAAAQHAAEAEIARQGKALERRSRVESQQASGAYDTDLSTLPGSDASDFESRRVAFGTGKTISIVSDGTAIPLLKQPTGSMKDESLYLSKGTTAFRATAYLNDDPVKWIEGKFTNAQGKEVRGWFNMNAMKSHINSASIDALKKQLKAFGVKNIGFSIGGLDDFTGLAMLHGTKRRPEAVLNADQTAFLRKDLLGKSRDSFMNIVRELQSLYSSNRATSMVAPAGDTYNFENVSLNFEPGTISNDYSARRAGDQVWDELLSMARKSGNVRVSRR